MKLYIVTPFEKQEFAIEWLEVNTPVGNFVIQPGHAPTVLTLSKNKSITFLLASGSEQSIRIPQGVAEITRIDATILVNKEI